MYYKKLIWSFGLVTFLTTPHASFAYKNLNDLQVSPSTAIVKVSAGNFEEDAQNFINNLAKQGIGFLENQDLSTEQREKEFRALLKNNFDMKTIGRFALGRYWKTSSKDQQKEYLDLFESMIVSVYSRRFSEYNGEALEVLSSRAQGDKDVLVSSQIVPQSGPKISVDWRVRKKDNGQIKVIDIMVEGVSMSLTQRADFASVIQRGGGNIDALLEHLRK